ncbi:heme o synthase [Flavobacteriaceae bacterium]|nr:heme o synthase [Flavobacteriaceae bacterium]MDB4590278.1 heme o synthase [Flavobacteriaceae bacterium]
MSSINIHLKKRSLLNNFLEITKVRLSVSVLFSSVAGYLLGTDYVSLTELILLCIGGYSMVGASNVYNQIIEKDLDVLMDRTKNRPIPSGRMSVQLAFIIAVSLTIIGIIALYIINPITAMFGSVCIFMYVSLYTPLKTKTPLSVFVGAFPGAIPFMLGWVAATGSFGIEPGTLFMIQFFWQFPHFWAIAWFLFDDYEKAGFFMLPTGKRDKSTALQAVLYTLWTVLASLIPVFGVTGKLYLTPLSGVLIGLIGLGFLYFSIRLYRYRSNKAAKHFMLVSVSYITLLQIIYVADKFIR